MSQATRNIETISVQASHALVQERAASDNFAILDVRTSSEFSDGYIEGAKNIDIYDPDFKAKLSKLDRKSTYLVYCRSGNRSRQSLGVFDQLGFTDVRDMAGGFGAWQSSGYPYIDASGAKATAGAVRRFLGKLGL